MRKLLGLLFVLLTMFLGAPSAHAQREQMIFTGTFMLGGKSPVRIIAVPGHDSWRTAYAIVNMTTRALRVRMRIVTDEQVQVCRLDFFAQPCSPGPIFEFVLEPIAAEKHLEVRVTPCDATLAATLSNVNFKGQALVSFYLMLADGNGDLREYKIPLVASAR